MTAGGPGSPARSLSGYRERRNSDHLKTQTSLSHVPILETNLSFKDSLRSDSFNDEPVNPKRRSKSKKESRNENVAAPLENKSAEIIEDKR